MRDQRTNAWPYVLGVAGFAALAGLGYADAALSRLGLSAMTSAGLLAVEVAFRGVNLRIGDMCDGRARLERLPSVVQTTLLRLRAPFADHTRVALNIGGALIPVGFATYALARDPVGISALLMASLLVAAVTEILRHRRSGGAWGLSYVVVAPALALVLGWQLGLEHRATLAYVSGLVGILAGADVLHLRDVRHIGLPEVDIGAAATFDAIFLNQMAALLFS